MLAPPDVQSLSGLVRRLRQWALAAGGGMHAADSAHPGPRWMWLSPPAGGAVAALKARAWRLERAL
ncbi:MAG: hypothetical protein QM772_06375 [Ottowia sp.]|uniref:hypothetical protein n=1 Tax=Ottowia sp. TaxID=1898956 RepID=UPI0039E3944D